MKKIFFILLLFHGVGTTAQNVGIGTTDPKNTLHTVGSFVVNTPSYITITPPTLSQTKTLINNSTSFFQASDSTMRIYDPGGPAGNYNSNLSATAIISDNTSAIGVELTLLSVQLGTGDSLIIKPQNSDIPFLAVGNNYSITGKWTFNTAELHIRFKSNTDASNGSGFELLVRKIYDNSSTLPFPSSYVGGALVFDPRYRTLRAGLISTQPMGLYSIALGDECVASGDYAVAMGNSTRATGNNAVALGNNSVASGGTSFAMGGSVNASQQYTIAIGFGCHADGIAAVAIGNTNIASGHSSVALGRGNSAIGDYAIALGDNTSAQGESSMALGRNTIASGGFSTVMGNYVSSNGQAGSFLIGDNSTVNLMNSPSPNNFRARFANGYRLYTSADYSTSCSLGAGDNAWTTTSDVRLKENFAAVDGEEILRKIEAMPLVTWNYKQQDPARFRHYGPMAQDFHAAFGKDIYGTIGNDTTINQADFAGVSFIGIQALAKQNNTLKSTIDVLLDEIRQLKAVQMLQQKELDAIKNRKKQR